MFKWPHLRLQLFAIVKINREAGISLKLGPEYFGLDFALVQTSEELTASVSGNKVGHVYRI